MKKEKIKTVEQVIEEEIKATPKHERTVRQKKILKNDRAAKVLTCVSGVFGITCIMGMLVFLGDAIYVGVEDPRLYKKYGEGIEQYKAEQIEALNEEFDGGKGFSTKEYKTRFDELNNHAARNYFENAASQEAKAEYEQYDFNVDTLTATGVSASIGGMVVFGAGVFGFTEAEKKYSKYMSEELSARAVQGKEKEL